jgi:hypothetical protein
MSDLIIPAGASLEDAARIGWAAGVEAGREAALAALTPRVESIVAFLREADRANWWNPALPPRFITRRAIERNPDGLITAIVETIEPPIA